MHSQDLKEIRDLLAAFRAKHSATLHRSDAGGCIDDALASMDEDIAHVENRELESGLFDGTIARPAPDYSNIYTKSLLGVS